MEENWEVKSNIDSHTQLDQLRKLLHSMSEPDIMQMLKAWTEAAKRSGTELEPEVILTFYEVLDEIAPIEPIPYDFHASWERFTRNNPQLFEMEEDAENKHSKKTQFRKRTLLISAAIIALLCGTAYATDFPETIYFWGQDFFQVHPVSGRTSMLVPDENGFITLEQALNAYKINVKAPTWIPKNYQLEEISVSTIENAQIITASYASNVSDTRPLYIRILRYSDEQSVPDMSYESDEFSVIDHFDIKNHDVIISTNEGISRVSWIVGNNAITVSGSLSEFELKQIVYSMN